MVKVIKTGYDYEEVAVHFFILFYKISANQWFMN
jgi:hypothetical protein